MHPALSRFVAAFLLMAMSVTIHALGVTTALRWIVHSRSAPNTFIRWTWRFVRLAAWMIFVHTLEIGLWAWFYAWRGAMPDIQTAAYFSAATYTTVGYGDVVLPVEWRMIGGIEALTGILMAGWSTGFFFAAVSQMIEAELPFKRVRR